MAEGTSKGVSRLDSIRRDKFSRPLRRNSLPAKRVKANASLTKGHCRPVVLQLLPPASCTFSQFQKTAHNYLNLSRLAFSLSR